MGITFELETDHRPLESIFGIRSKPCARIERWVLRLQSFKYKVIYKAGKSNIADPLSRLCEFQTTTPFDEESENYIRSIQESAAIDLNEIEQATKADRNLKVVMKCVDTNEWKVSKDPVIEAEKKKYQPFHEEFSNIDGLLIRGTKVVIPQSLRPRFLELAHEGHPGETVMKRRLRDRVWWPGMDREVESMVVKCEGCRLVSAPAKPEPMIRKALPTGPWIDIALDFLGPLPSGENLLVVIDYYSRYKEVEIMHRITAKETVSRLDEIFT